MIQSQLHQEGSGWILKIISKYDMTDGNRKPLLLMQQQQQLLCCQDIQEKTQARL